MLYNHAKSPIFDARTSGIMSQLRRAENMRGIKK